MKKIITATLSAALVFGSLGVATPAFAAPTLTPASVVQASNISAGLIKPPRHYICKWEWTKVLCNPKNRR